MKKTIILIAALLLLSFGCGSEQENNIQTENIQSEPETVQTETEASGEAVDNNVLNQAINQAQNIDNIINESNESISQNPIKENNISENTIQNENTNSSIQKELAQIESKSLEFENADWGSMSQQDMNLHTMNWYQLWDDELNSLWKRLSSELDEDTKARLLTEQREWIDRKEKNIIGAGASSYGGSLQPQIEYATAQGMTRVRTYILAEYLAKAKNEPFTMPDEIMEIMDFEDPKLEDTFDLFKGQWDYAEGKTGSIFFERSKESAKGVAGSSWTVYTTDNVIMSDLNVYGYTHDCILFKLSESGKDTFYYLETQYDDSVYLSIGNSLDAMDTYIKLERPSKAAKAVEQDITDENILTATLDGENIIFCQEYAKSSSEGFEASYISDARFHYTRNCSHLSVDIWKGTCLQDSQGYQNNSSYDYNDISDNNTKSICPKCNGTGKVICSYCNGTGQLVHHKHGTDLGHGSKGYDVKVKCGCNNGYYKCSRCAGSGYID